MKVHNIYQPIFSREQTQAADNYTLNEKGISGFSLMEKAGNIVCGAALKMLGLHKRTKLPDSVCIFIFCGPGNNGGDGFVCARKLWEFGISSLVLSLTDPNDLKDQAKTAYLQYKQLLEEKELFLPQKKSCLIIINDETQVAELLNNYEPSIIVDALFGVGLKKPLTDQAAIIVNLINDWRQNQSKQCQVLSVDIPSGLSANGNVVAGPHILADTTVTFSFKKITHVTEPQLFSCGEVICKDIGIIISPDELIKHEIFTLKNPAQVPKSLLIPIKANAHKGDFGHVMILEGSKHMRGASRLAARAALRAGAGALSLLVPETPPNAPYDLPEYIKRSYRSINENSLKSASAIVIGPGISDDEISEEALTILKLSLKLGLTIVLDAGGLLLLAKLKVPKSKSIIIATPHPGEAAHLLQTTPEVIQSDRVRSIHQLCDFSADLAFRVIWILKGACPIIAEKNNKTIICEGGLTCLAVAGSGDVLGGLIAGLIKQTDNAFDAAVLAVCSHLAVGKHLQTKQIRGYLASELADALPRVIYGTN
ncbi:MAG: NAD(P)H-hydrate dehydratase [bacterium]|nr:NAD(P)H-hydrate dehydratase [bacterium]